MKGLACTPKPYFFFFLAFSFIVSVYILDLRTFCSELFKTPFWQIYIEFSSIIETCHYESVWWGRAQLRKRQNNHLKAGQRPRVSKSCGVELGVFPIWNYKKKKKNCSGFPNSKTWFIIYFQCNMFISYKVFHILSMKHQLYDQIASLKLLFCSGFSHWNSLFTGTQRAVLNRKPTFECQTSKLVPHCIHSIAKLLTKTFLC